VNEDPRFMLEDMYESALGLRTVGWILLVLDVMVVGLFVFISLRDGSTLFPVWVMVQGLLGVVLIGAGIRKARQADQLLARMSTHVAERENQSPQAA